MIKIIETVIDVPEILEAVSHPATGASSLFLGTVRDHNIGKKVLYLEYECYIPMALKEMERIAEEVREKWDIQSIAIVHRLGRMEIKEASVAIAVSSAHRKESIEAMHYTINTLKKTVPIWKKEYWEDGSMWLENCCG